MASRGWKRNKLLSNFIKSKGKRASLRSQVRGKRQRKIRPTFSLIGNPSTEDSEHLKDMGSTDESNDVDMDMTHDIHNDIDDDDEHENPKVAKRSRRVNHARELEAWQNVLSGLIENYTINLAMPSDQACILCSNHAQYRCRDCSSLAFYCEECCRISHRYTNFFHMPELWTNGRYVISPFECVVLPLTHICKTAYKEKVTIVSMKGMV